jgi:hypothetical protein
MGYGEQRRRDEGDNEGLPKGKGADKSEHEV